MLLHRCGEGGGRRPTRPLMLGCAGLPCLPPSRFCTFLSRAWPCMHPIPVALAGLVTAGLMSAPQCDPKQPSRPLPVAVKVFRQGPAKRPDSAREYSKNMCHEAQILSQVRCGTVRGVLKGIEVWRCAMKPRSSARVRYGTVQGLLDRTEIGVRRCVIFGAATSGCATPAPDSPRR